MSVTRGAARVLVVSLMAVFALVATTGAANAEKVCKERKTPTGSIYECVDTDTGEVVTGGSGGGSSQPPCDLEAPYDDLCIGQDACWMNDPAAVQDPVELEGKPKPNEDSYVVYISCQRPDGTNYDRWYWSDDVPTITIEDRIRSAVGALDLPTITATFNPPGRTLVNLDTWWWADGAPAGEIRGSEALGMVAVATPRSLIVEPGDGSATKTCPMSVVESDTCTTNYRRAGDFTATMSILYDLQFFMDGQPFDAGQIPDDLRTLRVDDEVPVTVREVQTRVTKVR